MTKFKDKIKFTNLFKNNTNNQRILFTSPIIWSAIEMDWELN